MGEYSDLEGNKGHFGENIGLFAGNVGLFGENVGLCRRI